MAKNISFTIKYWKQNGPKDKGHFEQREMKNIPDDTSFLEMLDILNEQYKDMTTSIGQLLDDIAAGRKYMKVYRQMKMYNDPALNPVLYGSKK